ncbi:WXG100 family type VII secretion target [Paenibacillus sp. Marseille-Q7038]
MVKILVSPDQLMEVVRHFLNQRQELERMCNQLDKQIYFISEGWSGATKERFFQEYLSARLSMGVTMEKISSIAQLNFIARSFAEADGEGGSAIVMPSLPPKVEAKLESGVDYTASALKGVGATIEGLFNNVVGTGKSLWENPFGTAYDIGYAFTVGRVVDVLIGVRFAWDYAWGSGTARADAEQFVEQMKQDIEEKGTGYYAGYVTSQAAVYLTIGKLLKKSQLDDPGGSGGNNRPEGMPNGNKKFSDMSADEQLAIAKQYSQRAPIEIPENTNMKAKSMADGYEQITYKWNDGTYKYEVRWHTRTSGAPVDQGNTWVIQRTVPGSGGNKPQSFFKIGENEWIEGYKWYDAIAARKAGTATPEQVRILDQGHWKE